MDLKSPDSCLYLVSPAAPEEAADVMHQMTQAICDGLVLSTHDVSDGGVAVSLAEMAIAGELGLTVELHAPNGEIDETFFGRRLSTFVCEVSPEDRTGFEAAMRSANVTLIGQTTAEPRIEFRSGGKDVIALTVRGAADAWRTPLDSRAQSEEPQSSKVARSSSSQTMPALVSTPNILVVQAQGTNCDRETVEACKRAGGEPKTVHINELIAGHQRLDEFAALILPGGFSYGDHLGAGMLLAATLRASLGDQIERFVQAGRPVIGICNGFQALARLGLLGPVALAPNESGLFQCRWTPLRANASLCPYFDGLEEIELPVAHGEGRLIVESNAGAEVLKRAALVYEDSPNGAFGNIAGLCSPSGRVLGLMPHPERFTSFAQHPLRPTIDGSTPAGLRFFENVMREAARS
jgi:phosphoribosylformylglycinamidine synthase